MRYDLKVQNQTLISELNTIPSGEMGTLTDLDCGGGVGVPQAGGADLLAGEAPVAHVGHQGAVGRVDFGAEAARPWENVELQLNVDYLRRNGIQQ